MKNVIKIATIATMLAAATSASAFFGSDENNSAGYGTGSTDGAFDGKGRGAGKGDFAGEGNFSMTINASGRADSKIEADMDADTNNRWNGNTDFRGESSPQYNPAYYGVAPTYPTK